MRCRLQKFHLEQFSLELGFSKAIIQKDEVNDQEISSLFMLNLAAGLVLFILVNALAPFLVSVFDLPGLAGYIHVASFMLLIKAPAKVFRSALEREMKFKQLVKIRLARELLACLLLVSLLYFGYGIWSVVYVNLFKALLHSTALIYANYRLTSYRLIRSFSLPSLSYYYHFGKFVFGKKLISTVTKHLDEILIGYFLAQA